MKVATNLKALRDNKACFSGYNKVVRALQGKPFTEEDEGRESYIRFRYDEEIPLSLILENNGLDDALWALQACEQTRELQKSERMFGVWCARQVQNLMTDARSLAAIDVAERFANGNATDEELAASREAAWAAARDASREAARDAAWAAARAASREAARDASREAAWAAARDAAWAASREAAWAAARDASREAARDAAWAASREAARDAAWAASRDAQKQKFIEMFCTE